jgi:1-deoxy-D-xylulose-5-phosphate reductoisomerase
VSARRLVVLGATGSVGRSTLDVVARHAQRIEVLALTAHRDSEGLYGLCRQHRPRYAVLDQAAAALALQRRLREEGLPTEVLHGVEGLNFVAGMAGADLVVGGIVGAAGLLPTLAAARSGATLLIANKEPLVMAGALLMREARTHGAHLLPLDSEHNAIFQCLPGDYRCGLAPPGVRKLILTASGGPFREWSAEQLRAATPEQAVRHPNWTMGRKISVDSATLMNKGLELIEAATLYALPETAIEVVIHPESTIHSLVEYVDGSMLAQLGQPDMRIPIAHALAWPERWESGVGGLDLSLLGRLRFEPPDAQRFPCLRLARESLRSGGSLPNVLNAANEVAVEAFLNARIGFGDIPELIESCLEAAGRFTASVVEDLDSVLQVDAWARAWCREHLTTMRGVHQHA